MLKEIMKEILPIIEDTAPAIATALGLNSITAATPWAVYLLGKAFGIDMYNVQELPNAIKNDPDSNEKLADLNKSFADWFIVGSKQVTKNITISDAEINVKLNFDRDINLLSKN